MIDIHSYGIINKNDKHVLEWDGNYNSLEDKGELDIKVKDGKIVKKQHYKINMDNKFTLDILGFNPIQKSLDQRLEEDFFQRPIIKYEPLTLDGALIQPRKKRISNISRKKKNITRKKKTTRKRKHIFTK